MRIVSESVRRGLDALGVASKQIAVDYDFFQQERLFNFSLGHGSFEYRKFEYFLGNGKWRGLKWTSMLADRNMNRRKIAVGHSDKPFGLVEAGLSRAIPQIEQIWATNLEVPANLWALTGVYPLPLGLPNSTDESPAHAVAGDLQVLREVAIAERAPIEYRPYANFDPSTFLGERKMLWNLCSAVPWIVRGEYEISREGRKRYLEEMRRCGLVICPRGNGLDTHRFYEALSVGSLPVVLQRSYSYKVAGFFGFPVLGIESWEELACEETIHRRLEQVFARSFSLAALRFSFWQAIFLGAKPEQK